MNGCEVIKRHVSLSLYALRKFLHETFFSIPFALFIFALSRDGDFLVKNVPDILTRFTSRNNRTFKIFPKERRNMGMARKTLFNLEPSANTREKMIKLSHFNLSKKMRIVCDAS